jgi:hypothetical protein
VSVAAAVAVNGPPATAATAVPTTYDTPAITGTGTYSRSSTDLMRWAKLADPRELDSLTNLSSFGVPNWSTVGNPTIAFNRRLNLSTTLRTVQYDLISDTTANQVFATTTNFRTLPPMNIDFVTNGSHLIPVKQDHTDVNSYWDYAVGPGRIWREATDVINGTAWQRASFPFALIESNQNCTHNGVMTFAYSQTSITNVKFQISSETCKYHKFNMRGEVQVSTSTLSTSINQEQVRNDYAAEVAARMPRKAFASLKTDNGNLSTFDLTAFDRADPNHQQGSTTTEMTAYGVVLNDPTNGNALTNYVSECPTRHGNYPYCADLRMPSFSIAKSTYTGASYMHLRQQSSNVDALRIGTEIPALPDTWNGVSVPQTIDMATGHYNSTVHLRESTSDEASAAESQFLLATSYAAHVTEASDPYFAWHNNPGQAFVYQSHNSFLAARAMTRYNRGDLLPTLWSNVYGPGKAGLSKGAYEVLRTDLRDTWGGVAEPTTSPSGQAKGSHGQWFNRDDTGKIARLFNPWRGVINGAQVLHRPTLDASLRLVSGDLGLSANSPVDANERYNNGLWSTTRNGGTCNYPVSMMRGYGGQVVAMSPNNNASLWFYSDNNHFNWQAGMAELEEIRAIC